LAKLFYTFVTQQDAHYEDSSLIEDIFISTGWLQEPVSAQSKTTNK
jgi:hypothetical protein